MDNSPHANLQVNEKGQSYNGNGLLVSIITVVYNGEAFLARTIESVIAQTYKNIEYILIDGGSTDGTLDIIKQYKKHITHWKSEPDRGISDAFNKGIQQARGELIGIINADDWYAPEAVALVVSQYKPHSVLHGNMQYWNPDGSKGMLFRPNAAGLPREMTINHPTVFVARSVYAQHGVFSLSYKLSMDYHLLLRFYLASVPFITLNETLAHMRLGGFSANWQECYREVQRAKDEILGERTAHRIFYTWQVLRRRMSETLANTPLSFLNNIFRAYLSPMKKG